MHGEGGLDATTWFERASSANDGTRSGADSVNVRVRNGHLVLRKNFYCMKVIADWD
jgi:hypothetical protein